MAQLFAIHPDNPQERLVKQVAGQIKQGKILVLPTDACYVLCCHLGDKTAMERILAIRQIDLKHHLTLLCADLSELGTYAKVDNSQFRIHLQPARPQKSSHTHAAPQTQNHRPARARQRHRIGRVARTGRALTLVHPHAARRRRTAD